MATIAAITGLISCAIFAYIVTNHNSSSKKTRPKIEAKTAMPDNQHAATPSKNRAFFVLSTGRCGTKTLANVLDLSRDSEVFHEPEPLILAQALYAYQGKVDQWQAFWNGRKNIINSVWRNGKVYGETYHKSIFFANGISKNIPSTKFLVVVRDPFEVISVGMETGWYRGNGKWDQWRIRPEFSNWRSLHPFEKCCWLWAETYRRILFFTETIPRENWILVRFDDMVKPDFRWASIFQFLEIAAPDSEKIAYVMAQKLNSKRLGSFPTWQELPQDYKETLIRHCGIIAENLGVKIGGE